MQNRLRSDKILHLSSGKSPVILGGPLTSLRNHEKNHFNAASSPPSGGKFPQCALDIKNRKKSPVPVLIIFSTPGFWIFKVPWSHPELPQATGANHLLSQPRKGGWCKQLPNPPTRQLNSPPWRFLASWWNSSPVSSQMTSLSSASRDVDVYVHQPEILSNFFRPLSGSPLMTFRWKVC